jgi:hypothetical protein
MKSRIIQPLVAVIAAGTLHFATGFVQAAEEQAAPAYKQFNGTIKSIDKANASIDVKGFWLWSTSSFQVGDPCLILLQDKKEAAFPDLRPGQRVLVRYRTLDGVKVASQITEDNPDFTGHISALDPDGRTFKVKDSMSSKQFVADPGCVILGRENKTWTMADLKLGHRVTVTYLDLGSTNVASKIQQSSLSFSGTLEAIDADARILRAQHLLAEKKFSLAAKCPIVVGERIDGKLSDLSLGDKLVVHYEIMDGVLVANRIELQSRTSGSPAEQASKSTETAAPAPSPAQP